MTARLQLRTTWLDLGPILVRLGVTTPVFVDALPAPYYPDCDIHDSGPQNGYYWRRVETGMFYRLVTAGGTPGGDLGRPRNLVPSPVFDRLTGLKGRPYHPPDIHRAIDCIYPTVEAAVADLTEAAVKWALSVPVDAMECFEWYYG